ncbi:MAG: riboflavin synthase [Candidatus Micrarchaeia archaeon]
MRIGIVDTTFSRVDMGRIAADEITKSFPGAQLERRTVPGIKDLAVECKILLDSGCDIAMALGMVGGAPIDTQCAHEASLGIQQAKLMTNKHVIEVFVHENEAWSGAEFIGICEDRIRKHAHNAIHLVGGRRLLAEKAGRGVRQGREDEGPAEKDKKILLGIVAGSFNGEITSRMKENAVKRAKEAGAETIVIDVPGVYDMPLVVKKLLMDKKVDGVVALGAVVKGDTAHDEVITKDAAKRLGELSLEMRKPVTLGIIGHGVDWEGAVERADGYAQRATDAAIYLIKLLRKSR